jgi:hypothetical protein
LDTYMRQLQDLKTTYITVTHLPGTEPNNGHLLSIVKCNTAQLLQHCDVQHTA